MSGVTGFKEYISGLRNDAELAGILLHQKFTAEVLDYLVVSTWHSSSNAAFNWRVSEGAGIPSYVDFKDIEPVGSARDIRSDRGDTGAIQAVAAAAVSRENRNTIDNLYSLQTVTFSNATDFVSNLYASRARLEQAVDIVSAYGNAASNIAKLNVSADYSERITGWFK